MGFDSSQEFVPIEGAHFIHDLGCGFLTNVPFWNSTSDFAQLSGRFQEFLNRPDCDQKSGEITVTMDKVAGGGTQKSHRVVREEENEEATGGLRNAARSVSKVPGWNTVGTKISGILLALVDEHQVELSKVLDNLGNKTEACLVPEALCCKLRERLCSMLELGQDALVPGPGGLFLGLFQGLTQAAQDPDVHVHNWLRGEVLLGITTYIPTGGVFPVVSPQCVGREKDRLRYVNAKVWGFAKLLRVIMSTRSRPTKFCKTRSTKDTYSGRQVVMSWNTKLELCSWPKLRSLSKVKRFVSYTT